MKCFQAFIFFSVLMVANVHASPTPDENEILQALTNMSPQERQELLNKVRENDYIARENFIKAEKERLLSKVADLDMNELKTLQKYIPERIMDLCSHDWREYSHNVMGCDDEYKECLICGKRE